MPMMSHKGKRKTGCDRKKNVRHAVITANARCSTNEDAWGSDVFQELQNNVRLAGCLSRHVGHSS